MKKKVNGHRGSRVDNGLSGNLTRERFNHDVAKS